MKSINNNDLTVNQVGEVLTLHGWVNKRRDMGGLIFVDLRDRSGFVQVVFNKETMSGDYSLAEGLRNEYCIEVKGTLSRRVDEQINKNVPTGEVELIVDELVVLSEADVLPFNLNDDSAVFENTALKYRYLELRKPRLQNNLIVRHKIAMSTREYLNSLGFLEIETPILCKSTPEGARDYIVPSRVAPGNFYALPQSPQIFKQLLMVAGYEKYYQIAKCFRDEDLRADRQPEFTQIDIEMSFVEQEDIMNTVEGLIKKVVKDVKGLDIPVIPRMTYKEAMNRYGSDKPDTRFDMELNDITEVLSDSSMNLFRDTIAEGGIAKCLVVKNGADKYSRKDIDNLTEFVKVYGAKGLAWFKLVDGEYNGSIAKSLESDKLDKIKEMLNLDNNDLVLIVASKPKVVFDSLGALRLKIAKEIDMIDNSKLNFLWVVDFPMFEYSESDNRFKSMHHPFTMPASLEALKDPENCLSIAYDIVLNGYELGGGSKRIHDPKMQKVVFEALGLSDEDIKNKFGFFIDAFNYGTPPHAGLAFGLERFTMLMAGTENIKDVIAFPKTQNASDLMSEAPSIVSFEQLKELGIKFDMEDINE